MDPTDGTLCQYFTCRSSMTVPIPDNVSWEEAGSIQPLAIAVQLARRAALNSHQTMAILYVPLAHLSYASTRRSKH
jgi:D-xylulose reductase